MKVISLLINFILLSLSLQDNKIDYLKEAAHWVDIVYKKVYDSECTHVSPHPRTFEEIPKKKQ